MGEHLIAATPGRIFYEAALPSWSVGSKPIACFYIGLVTITLASNMTGGGVREALQSVDQIAANEVLSPITNPNP